MRYRTAAEQTALLRTMGIALALAIAILATIGSSMSVEGCYNAHSGDICRSTLR